MPFLSHDGRSLFYRDAGKGPSILLIHGAGASSAVWLGIIHRLARRHRVIAPDLPGHGRSPGQVASVNEMRDAVGLCAATLCLGPSLLVGHSLGGLVALSAALAWPDKVPGLVLVTTGARLKVSAAVFGALESDFARWQATFAELGYSPDTPADVRRRGASIACAAPQAQVIADFRAADAYDARARLAEVRAPTRVITGEHDLFTPPRWGAALAAGITGAERVSLASCGHMPMHERADALAHAIAEHPAASGH